jgi:hypothetical protein
MSEQQIVRHPFQETEEELVLIKQAILLPFMLTLVENNKNNLKYQVDPLKDLYIAVAELLMNQLHDDLVQVKKEMREKSIKLIENGRSDSALKYRYKSRGYEHRFDIMRSLAKAEISVKLGQKVHSLLKQLYEVEKQV